MKKRIGKIVICGIVCGLIGSIVAAAAFRLGFHRHEYLIAFLVGGLVLTGIFFQSIKKGSAQK